MDKKNINKDNNSASLQQIHWLEQWHCTLGHWPQTNSTSHSCLRTIRDKYHTIRYNKKRYESVLGRVSYYKIHKPDTIWDSYCLL